ncbi:hypothetical protein SB49_14000 [Sediminicola sp. YIK13]|uniref:hypothetical protein n=1 Tax=Sediminicola sp. YIK13 TaxID=1453352 RepID=UPI000720C698|nr:hypothetical protein [Sediminicola sp. YIK13]ALM08797.1 hypothetical protein SB49_14000 [Sediminicola sp. YIK13]
MLLDQLKTYVNLGNHYYGLEVIDNQVQIEFHLLEVIRKKGELLIGSQKTFSNLEEIINIVKKGSPLLLSLNTGNVITKVMDSSTNTNLEAKVHNAFPNLDFDNFYFQAQSLGNKSLVTITKKENVNVLLDKIKELKIEVAGFSLGISSLKSIFHFMPQTTFQIYNNQILMENGSIRAIASLIKEKKVQSINYDLNGLTITSEQVLNFGAILSFISEDNHGSSNFEDTFAFLKMEFRAKRRFNLLLKSSLIFILAILFGNFIIFNHYFEKVENLKTTSEFNSANREKLIQLGAMVKKKEERVNALLSSSNSKSSYYIDKIVKTIPSSILLDQLNYQPLIKPVRESKPIEVEDNVILMSGKASNGEVFSDWIEQLEKFTWISSVETMDYDYNNSNSSNFSLKIRMDEN